MSIVEKALSKIDKGAVRSARLREPIRRTTVPAAVQATADAVAAPDTIDLPAQQSIEIDTAALRAAGAMPPADLQHRVLDQFRRIKWPLLATSEGTNTAPTQFIMVTSALPGEGKTFVTLNLALSLTLERDSQVLIVDSDVAKQDLTRLLGLVKKRGLMDYLLDESLRLEDVIYDTSIDGLKVLPAGKRTAHAPEHFGSKRMASFYDGIEARSRNRVVLIDSSPLLAANEAQVIARDVDKILFVVRAEATTESQVRDALALLESTGNVSCVLNQASASSREGYYGDYAVAHE
jgi:exopolysaccharide/PEP-CTERM locus tyrosine autokinase